jgi:GTP-binding protein
MQITKATFVISSPKHEMCPKPIKPEYAFIGRSNVGKSSLINALVNHKELAKTSGKPGKTQLINHFLINESWYLVDLPGYGFAKVAKGVRSAFEPMITDYMLNRTNMMCAFVLIDIRHEPQENDLKFLRWLGEKQVPFAMIFTKSDKLKPEDIEGQVQAYNKVLLEEWEELPQQFITSSARRQGVTDILRYIGEVNKAFDPKAV